MQESSWLLFSQVATILCIRIQSPRAKELPINQEMSLKPLNSIPSAVKPTAARIPRGTSSDTQRGNAIGPATKVYSAAITAGGQDLLIPILPFRISFRERQNLQP